MARSSSQARALIPWAACLAVLGFGCRPKSGGELSVAQLTAVVAREQASLTPCYQNALDKTPYDHEFRIESVLRIRPDGSVADVSIDQAGLEGVGPCVTAAIRTWKFPPAQAETRTRLPIVFRPKVEKALPENFQLPPGFKVLQGPQ
jgi:hypothetical protein